jgi:hypothetical protein
MRIGIGTLGLIGFVLLFAEASATAGERSAAERIAAIPVVQSSDPTIQTIELVGSMTLKDAGLVRVRALYQVPGHFSILLSDSTDGTPLVYVADRQLLFYDPIRSSVTCLKDCFQRLTLGGDGKSAGFAFEVGRRAKKGAKKGLDGDLLQIDPKSLFGAKGGLDPRIVDEGGGRYRLSTTTGDRTVVAAFDASQPQPFEGLKVFEKSSHEPALSIDKLVVNGPLPKDSFTFPDRERLSKKITIHELAVDFLPPGAEMVQLSRAIQTRFLLKHPGLREDAKPPGFERLTWKQIQRHDQKASNVLRELIPVDRRSVATPEVKKPAGPASASTVVDGGSTLR